MVVMMMGLPGSGKSFFSQRLSKLLKMEYLGSDQTRKEMKLMGRYSMEEKLQVYDQMEFLAEKILGEGKDVVVDATFIQENLRIRFISLAMRKAVPYVLFWVEASERIIKERLSMKREDSEADFNVYLTLSRQLEEPALPYLKLESKKDNINEMLKKAEAYIHRYDS
jgi:predicted kinase